jgi:hypothetical protein
VNEQVVRLKLASLRPWVRRLFPFLLVVLLCSCRSDGYMHATLNGGSKDRVRVLIDSPSVRESLRQAVQADENHKTRLASRDPKEQMAAFMDPRPGTMPAQIIKDLMQAPSYEAPGHTRCKILFESNAFPFDKIQFESGPSKGQVGWIAKGSFPDRRFEWP